MSTLLQVKNLKIDIHTRNGVVKAVGGISYELAEGEMIGIVGESGSGKSVSALSLLRLLDYPKFEIVSGEIIFEGKDLLKLSEEEMRHIRGNEIAMIFQDPMTSFNPVLTIGRQISESLELHLEMDKKAALQRSIELLEMVGIAEPETKLKSYPHHFSGGMLQRAMIAMALSCNPKLLIADEPTSALDVTTQAQVLELIKNLTAELGVAVIFITHNLGLVARYVDRVMVMYAGHIVETAPVAELYSNPKHPYTVGLLKSVPRLDEKTSDRLATIYGSPPNLSNMPTGCPFLPRCHYAIDKCAEKVPELKLTSKDHGVACMVKA
ncbi:ABC transporter ATP-binding protein [Chloroflexota bacterium]